MEMRTFMQKHDQTRQRVQSDITRSSTAAVAMSHRAHPFRQHMIDNQAMQRRRQANPDDLEVASTTRTANFAHDFSQIPAHSESLADLKAKQLASPNESIYEREADRVAEQVMRMPDPHDVGAQISGASESEDEGKHDKFARQQLRGATARAPTVTDGIVNEVLNSPGQPIDAVTRAYFEPRFGHDFSHVRIHVDRLAEESAIALAARAYTVKGHVVFGPSHYSPHTLSGRGLLAHELAHVIQQDLASSVGSELLLRKPDKPTQAELRQEHWLEELARDPDEAHQAWNKLSEVERFAVAAKMEARYGAPFARQFLNQAKKGKPQRLQHHYGRGSAPKPSELVKKGYQRGWTEHIAADMALEWWVHPSGSHITIDVGTWKHGAAESKTNPEHGTAESKTSPKNKAAAPEPAKIDPSADRDKLFGPVVAFRENVDAAFGIGDMVRYQDGTIELFLEGTGGTSYVFRPLAGGQYTVYGPDGQRLQKAWHLPESDFPDLDKDAVE